MRYSLAGLVSGLKIIASRLVLAAALMVPIGSALAQTVLQQAVQLLQLSAKCPLPPRVDEVFTRAGNKMERTVSSSVYNGDATNFKMTTKSVLRVHDPIDNDAFVKTFIDTERGWYSDVGSVELTPSGEAIALTCRKGLGACFRQQNCYDFTELDGTKGCEPEKPTFVMMPLFCDSKTAANAKRAIDVLLGLANQK